MIASKEGLALTQKSNENDRVTIRSAKESHLRISSAQSVNASWRDFSKEIRKERDLNTSFPDTDCEPLNLEILIH